MEAAGAASGVGSVSSRCLTLLREYPDDVVSAISPLDNMFIPERDDYWVGGQAGLDAVRLGLLAAQMPSPESILDLPSGFGRVLRYLRAEYPEAQISACDIDHRGVDFCVQEFGAEPVYGHERPGDIELDRQFDLVWCGSLLTHLDQGMWIEFFDFFEQALAPRGLLLVSIHGEEIAGRLRDPVQGPVYIPSEEGRQAILEGYEKDGFGFAEYPTSPETRALHAEPSSYGISLTKPSWICSLIERRPELQAVTFTEARWGGQDVIGLVRDDPARPFQIPFGA
jgi:SAM-dependent methyltransferase